MAYMPQRPSPIGANVCGPIPPPHYNNNNDRWITNNEIVNNVYGDYYDFKGARNGPVIHHHYHGGNSPPQQNYNYQQGAHPRSYNRPNNTYQQPAPEWRPSGRCGSGLDSINSSSPVNVPPSYESFTRRPISSIQPESADSDYDSDSSDDMDLYSAAAVLTTYHRKD